MSDKRSTLQSPDSESGAGDMIAPFAITAPQHVVDALASARCADPCAWLGMHAIADQGVVVRALLPDACKVEVLAVDALGATASAQALAVLAQRHSAGVFEGLISDLFEVVPYRLRVTPAQGEPYLLDDAYRFGAWAGSDDQPMKSELELFSAGEHTCVQSFLGAHCARVNNVRGVRFSVWAPNAQRVSVIGAFNDWDARRLPLRLHPEHGVWELFVPGVEQGALYKFDLLVGEGETAYTVQKADPLARATERPPANASRVAEPPGLCASAAERFEREAANSRQAPVSIYEVHLGSWRRGEDNRYLDWDELADTLLPYVQSLNFTHLQLLPIAEYPFSGSWGYQPVSLFAPSQRFGDTDGFRRFVERAHRSGLGVLLDWVPAHFPADAHGLASFDGTCLYEHEHPFRREHPDWGTLIYNYGRNEVRSFLLSSAQHWLDHYGVDGLRVDAVASMLYLDYSRKEGEWLPNKNGGRENLEAVEFIKALNVSTHRDRPGTMMVAEESTAWDGVTRPVDQGGLGFGYKWNMGWMNDTLRYLGEDPVHRSYHHDTLTFSLVYAFAENFVLPLSHDEVVHGKGSLLTKMPGDRWQQFANLRLCYGYMWAHPGKKLLFMGGEFAQQHEWNHDQSLDWHLLAQHEHRGVQHLIADLNRLYVELPALHDGDCNPDGFQWLDVNNARDSIIGFSRRSDDGQCVVAVCNFTPVVRNAYRLGVPAPGYYREVLNSDSERYGGSNVGNHGGVTSEPHESNACVDSVVLTLPPLACVYLVLDSQVAE